MAGPLPTTDEAQGLLSKGVIDGPTYNAIINANKGYPQDLNAMQSAGKMPDLNTQPAPPPPTTNGFSTPTQTPQAMADAGVKKDEDLKRQDLLKQNDFEQNQAARANQMQLAAQINQGSQEQTQQASPSIPNVLPSAQVGHNSSPAKEYLKQIDDIKASQQESAGRAQTAEDLIAQAKTEQHQQISDLIANHVADDQAATTAQNQRMQQAQADANKAFDAVTKRANAIKDMDPKHWFKEVGTGGTILAALSVGLGALGSGLSGIHGKGEHPNSALNIINGAINRDVEAQKDNYEKQWKQVSLDKNMADDKFAQAKFMDARATQDKAEKWLLVNHQVDSLTNAAQAKIDPQAAEILKSGIQDKLNENLKSDAKDRYSVLEREASKQTAAAQAAANAQPINIKMGDKTVQVSRASILQANQDYAEYHKNWTPKKGALKSRDAFISEELGLVNPDSSGSGGSVENPTPVGSFDEKGNRTGTQMRSAISKKAQTSYTAVTTAADEVEPRLIRMRNFMASHQSGWGSDTVNRDQVAQFESDRQFVRDYLPGLKGAMRAPSHGELGDIYSEDYIPQYSHWFGTTNGRNLAKLNGLIESVHGARKAAADNYLMPVGQSAPVSSGGENETPEEQQ